jgi:putative oxidoreductase
LIRTDRVLTGFLAFAFLGAGVMKIVDPAAFALSIARLRMAPMAAVGTVAILLPWIEVVAAAALFVPKFRLSAAKLLLGMLIAFTLILGIAILRGSASSCGCFGSSDLWYNRPPYAILRNVSLMLTAVGVIFLTPTSPAAPSSPASDTGR